MQHISEFLFDEIHAERSAIMEHCAGLDRATADRLAAADTRKHMHECEVRDVVKRYQRDGGEAVKDFLALVAKHRGQPSADKLRNDALEAIKASKK